MNSWSETMARTSSPQKTEEAILFTVRQVAGRLSLSRSSLYNMMDQGRLPYVKLGRSRRIQWDDVMQLIENNTVGGNASRT
jgi:excisionase family DNA binding protein